LRSVRASNLYDAQCSGPHAYSLTTEAFLSAASKALNVELAEALLAAVVDTGEDLDTCLDLVTDAPLVHLVVAAGWGDTPVLAASLDMSTVYRWLEAHPDAADAGVDVVAVRLLDPPAAAEPYDHSAAKEDARNEGFADQQAFFTDREAVQTAVEAALRRLYGPLNAESIINADAFGALVNRIAQHGLAHPGTPLAILQAIDAGDRDFAIHGADEPAAFLAAKVRDL
jgi:hypothetical protein